MFPDKPGFIFYILYKYKYNIYSFNLFELLKENKR